MDLRGANLHKKYMASADIAGADLRGAYLSGVDFGRYWEPQGGPMQDEGADLSGADLRGHTRLVRTSAPPT